MVTNVSLGDFFGQSDRIIENKLRRIGALLWEEMKIGGKKAFDSSGAGVSTLKEFKEYLAENNVKIHLVGHSAGAILLAHLIEAADQLDISIESCNLMAPACQYLVFANRERWNTQGWAEKFGMPPVDRWGVGDTPEQVGSFPEVAAEIVAGYRADVLESTQPVIRGLSEADLETTNPERNPRHPRPAPTFNWVLARIPVECSQHIGQVAYIRGLMPDQEDWRS